MSTFLIGAEQRGAESELDKLISEIVPQEKAGTGPGRRAEGVNGKEWDRLTLLSGGFVPVGSIFWARPPKLLSQQRITLAMEELDAVPEEGGILQAARARADILLNLACEFFQVREGSAFRKATREEVGGDEHGLDAMEIRDAFYKLMGIDVEAATEGNA